MTMSSKMRPTLQKISSPNYVAPRHEWNVCVRNDNAIKRPLQFCQQNGPITEVIQHFSMFANSNGQQVNLKYSLYTISK